MRFVGLTPDCRATLFSHAAVLIGTSVLICASPAPALAQSLLPDMQLSYQNGVVYDDDLVPGRPVNQPFLVEEQANVGFVNPSDLSAFGQAADGAAFVPPIRRRSVPPPSPNLIGSDGRAAAAAVRRQLERERARPDFTAGSSN